MDKYGGDKITKVKQLSTQPESGDVFMMSYERPQAPTPRTYGMGKTSKRCFHKDNVKADPSKFKFELARNVTVDVSKHIEKKHDDCREKSSDW